MPEINKRYIRTSPLGDESIVIIKTEKEGQYQQGLVAEGYKFKEVVPSVAPEGVCVSCEG